MPKGNGWNFMFKIKSPNDYPWHKISTLKIGESIAVKCKYDVMRIAAFRRGYSTRGTGPAGIYKIKISPINPRQQIIKRTLTILS